MLYAFLSLIVVLIVVLIISEYRHYFDRQDFKELSLNQQSTIRELLEIVRFRSGMPTAASSTQEVKPAENKTFPSSFLENQTNPFLTESGNGDKKPVQNPPVGYEARKLAQEKEEENENMKTA
jgi:hypothetical protein